MMTHPTKPQPHSGLSRRSLLGLMASAAVIGRIAPASAAPAIGGNRRIAPGLYEIVVNPTANRVYVASAGQRGANDASILVLDPVTLEASSAIELRDEPAFGLALNNKTQTLYTTNTRSGSVSAIDLRDNSAVKISEGEGAHLRQVLVDEDSNTVYASSFGAKEKPSAVWIIDGAAKKVAGTIGDLKGGIAGLALDKAGKRLFATAMGENAIVEIDLVSRTEKRRFPSGGERPINLAFDAANGRLLVANQGSGDMTVLNAADGKLLNTVKTGEGALGLTLSPGNGLVYVANRGAGTVSVIDGKSLSVLANLATGTHPNTVAVDPRTNFAYVTNKAKMSPRGQPPVEDPNGDTVTIIKP